MLIVERKFRNCQLKFRKVFYAVYSEFLFYCFCGNCLFLLVGWKEKKVKCVFHVTSQLSLRVQIIVLNNLRHWFWRESFKKCWLMLPKFILTLLGAINVQKCLLNKIKIDSIRTLVKVNCSY